MSEQFETKGLRIYIDEDRLEATAIPTPPVNVFREMIFPFLFYMSPLIAFSIYLTVVFTYYIGFLALLPVLIFAIAVIYIYKTGKENEEKFRFCINEYGITYTFYKGMYHIKWQELLCFGFVNNIPTSMPPSKREYHQMCAYFSNKRYTRKKLDFSIRVAMPGTKLLHCSKKHTLCLCFLQNEVDESLIQKIHNLVEKYCVECWRLDIIEELDL